MAWDKREPDVFFNGREAFVQKLHPSQNPHDKGTSSHREWFRGWRYQKKKAGQGKRKRSSLGAQAFRNGLKIGDNPHEPGGRAYREWQYSWEWAAYNTAHAEGYRARADHVYHNPHLKTGGPLMRGWKRGHELAEFHITSYGQAYERWMEPKDDSTE